MTHSHTFSHPHTLRTFPFPSLPSFPSSSTSLIHLFPSPSLLESSDTSYQLSSPTFLQFLQLFHICFHDSIPLPHNLHFFPLSSPQYHPSLISFPNLYLTTLLHLLSAHLFLKYSGTLLSFTHPYHLLYREFFISSYLSTFCISFSFLSISSHTPSSSPSHFPILLVSFLKKPSFPLRTLFSLSPHSLLPPPNISSPALHPFLHPVSSQNPPCRSTTHLFPFQLFSYHIS